MKTAYVNGKLLDGTEEMQVQEGLAILTEGEKIVDILPEKEVPDGCERVDLGGRYIMPGLINMHVHLAGSGKPQKKQRDNEKLVRKLMATSLSRAVAYSVVKGFAKEELFSGVTTIRTVGGLGDFDSRLRDEILEGKCEGPRILAANQGISVPGGHMAGSVAVAAANVEEALAQVKTAEELGGLVASDNAGNDIKEIKSIPTKAAQLATNNTGKMSLVGMTNESDAKDYLKTYGKILSGDDSLQTFGPEIENSWASFDKKTKKALYDYTTGSSYVNEPLHGQKYLSYKGKDAVEDIDLLTKAIDGSTVKESTVMYHGVDTNGFCAMFGLSSYDGEKTLNSIIGKEGKDTGFYSCGSSEGSGFQHKAFIIDTFIPAGSKGIYVEPFSYYGNGQKGSGWNGKVAQSSVSQENETILQRNGRYKATGWYVGSDGKTHVIAELVGQYPEQMGADQYEKYCGK